MSKEEALNIFKELLFLARSNKVLVLKGVFLIVMMLLGHHRGLIHIWPVKIPVAHGLNQILGAIAGLAVGIVILALTNRLLGW